MFLSDQGRDAIIIKRILTFQHLPAIGAPSSVGQVYLGPFYYYLIAPFLLLFNFNPVGMSYGSALLSIIGILSAYFIIKKEFNKITALIFTFLITFSSVNIEMSRFSWNPNLLPYFSFFTLYFFYKLSQKNNLYFAFLFGAFLSFSIQLHYLAALLVLPISVYFLKTIITIKKKTKYLIYICISIVSFLVVSFPLIIFDLRHNFINTGNFIKLFSQGGMLQQTSLLSRYLNVSQSALTYVFSTQFNQILTVITGIALILWILSLRKTKLSCFFVLNIANIILYFFGFALFNSPRFPHYFGQVYLSLYLVFAYFFAHIKEYLPKYWKVIIVIFFIGYIIANLPKYYFLYQPGTNQISHSQKVAEFLATKIDNKPFNVATWPVELTEDNYLYFLELKGLVPVDRNKIEISNQMFVLCNRQPCKILGSPSWNISMFGPAKIDKIWEIEGISIYRLLHNK